MSDTASPPTAVLGLGLDLAGVWHQRAVHTSRALVQTYLLSSSPTTEGGGRGTRPGTRTRTREGSGVGAPLRLPSLGASSKGLRRRSNMTRLSLSEPSLLTPESVVAFEGFPSHCCSSALQKRCPPPPPPLAAAPPFSRSSLLRCSTCKPHLKHFHLQNFHSDNRPAFLHFSHPIQPSTRPRPARRHSHNPALSSAEAGHQADLRSPHLKQQQNQVEPLLVVGKPCLPSCSSSQRPPAVASSPATPSRTQIHVFLPTEAEGEEVDRESVDEGFMDELDSRITSMKLQQATPKTATYH